MQMTPDQVESCINRIAWGKKFITAEDSDGRERTLIVGALSLHFRNFVDFAYKKALRKAVDAGIHTEAEMLQELSKNNVWTSDDDNKIKYLKSELVKIQSQEDDFVGTKRAKKRLEKLKKSIVIHIEELVEQRSNLLMHCAERVAHEQRIRAFIFAVLQDENGERFWKSWEDFSNFEDNALMDSIISQISHFDQKITTTEIRYIARHPNWRFRWVGGKSTGNIFDVPVVEMTDEQASLVYWSHIYDSVYDAYERPSQEIIDDDEKLDEWMSEQGDKSEREAKKRVVSSRRDSISSRVMGHGEVFIASQDNMIETEPGRGWGGGDKAARGVDPDKVNELNDPLAKKFRAIQRKRIKEHGVIEERDLRKDADSRRVIGSKDAIVSKKRDTDGFTKRVVDKLLPGGTIKAAARK